VDDSIASSLMSQDVDLCMLQMNRATSASNNKSSFRLAPEIKKYHYRFTGPRVKTVYSRI